MQVFVRSKMYPNSCKRSLSMNASACVETGNVTALNFAFSTLRSPTPPSNVVALAQKISHILPFCSKVNFVWGGRGTVPTFFTSIVQPKCVPQLFLGSLLRTGASNSLCKSKLVPVFFSLLKWRIPANTSYYEYPVCAP